MNEELNQEQIVEEMPQQETVPESTQEMPQENEQPQSTYEDNIVALRELREAEAKRAARAEYERDELARYVEGIQRQLSEPQQTRQNEYGIQDDDYVEGKHLGKVANQMKELKKEVHQWKTYSEETTAELKLNNEFNDFNNVVTEKNVQAFLAQYPEMRGSIQNSDTLYNRGKAAYKLIKKFMAPTQQQQINQRNQTKAQQNLGKPMPSSSLQQQNSPLSQANMFANGYTEEIGQALEDEMYNAISKY